MRQIRNNKQGFTMVELLVVLVIVGILAAVAAPIFAGNTKKAQASEAVATMSLIRQALRDRALTETSYPTVAKGAIDETTGNKGLNLDVGVSQYFSNDAFEVIAAADTGPWKGSPTGKAVDFIITAKGADSVKCATGSDDCAVNYDKVADYELQMDNSGLTYVSYDKGSKWDTCIR